MYEMTDIWTFWCKSIHGLYNNLVWSLYYCHCLDAAL